MPQIAHIRLNIRSIEGMQDGDGALKAVCPALQMQTVPYLIDNPEVGYVQTRWVFRQP